MRSLQDLENLYQWYANKIKSEDPPDEMDFVCAAETIMALIEDIKKERTQKITGLETELINREI